MPFTSGYPNAMARPMKTSVAKMVTMVTAMPRRGNSRRCRRFTIGLSSSATNPATIISSRMSRIR